MYAPKNILWLGLLLWSSANVNANEIHNNNDNAPLNEVTSTLDTARRAATTNITTIIQRKISAVVLEDKNDDGIGDSPIAGDLVGLYTRNGNLLTSAYTNFNGKVNFFVPSGLYVLTATIPPGYIPVKDNDGGDPIKIMDVDTTQAIDVDNRFIFRCPPTPSPTPSRRWFAPSIRG